MTYGCGVRVAGSEVQGFIGINEMPVSENAKTTQRLKIKCGGKLPFFKKLLGIKNSDVFILFQ